MPRARQATIVELATRLADGRLRLDVGVDWDDAEQNLLAIPGVGAWTASYVRMRALGDPDVFLPTDLGVKNGLARLGLPTGPGEIARRAERWRPWRSYALTHVWSAPHGHLGSAI
jgi:AraC family transcriptional regulator of adaptative response / DNA-3-methyladenine glycosylase II